MANTTSAKKANRSSLRKRVLNVRRLKTMRSSVKDMSTVAKTGKGKEVAEKLSEAYQAIDKAAKRGVVKKNTAARMKSRLAKMIATK